MRLEKGRVMWHMLTLVGKDQACIVAEVTRVLYEQGADLGEASMIRLGGNFTIMLMVNFHGDPDRLKVILTPVTKQYQLTMHIDEFEGTLHDHMQADVQISIYGADRSGIVASATDALSAAGLYVLELRTDRSEERRVGKECRSRWSPDH